MTRPSQSWGRFLWLGILLVGIPTLLAAYSHVRIVRISFVDGEVTVAQPASTSGVQARAYQPLEHDAVLETGDGVVEVEFEDDIIARMAEDTHLHLSELGLRDDGGRVTQLTLRQGTANFYAKLKSEDTLQVITPYFTVVSLKKAKFRVDLTRAGGRVQVFDGKVEVETPDEVLELSEGRQFEWDAERAQVALGPLSAPDGWDEWNQKRDEVVENARRRARWAGVITAVSYDSHYHYGHHHHWGWCPYYDYGYAPVYGLYYAYYRPAYWYWSIGFGWYSPYYAYYSYYPYPYYYRYRVYNIYRTRYRPVWLSRPLYRPRRPRRHWADGIRERAWNGSPLSPARVGRRTGERTRLSGETEQVSQRRRAAFERRRAELERRYERGAATQARTIDRRGAPRTNARTDRERGTSRAPDARVDRGARRTAPNRSTADRPATQSRTRTRATDSRRPAGEQRAPQTRSRTERSRPQVERRSTTSRRDTSRTDFRRDTSSRPTVERRSTTQRSAASSRPVATRSRPTTQRRDATQRSTGRVEPRRSTSRSTGARVEPRRSAAGSRSVSPQRRSQPRRSSVRQSSPRPSSPSRARAPRSSAPSRSSVRSSRPSRSSGSRPSRPSKPPKGSHRN